MDINHIIAAWKWFSQQNLAVQAIVVVGALNILIAGFRAMGWTWLADQCQKIEDAIQAMLNAAKLQLFRKKTDGTDNISQPGK